MRTQNVNNIKKGDVVLVDIDFANGGYEAEVVHVGDIFARIKSGGYEWDIMISRLTPKTYIK